MGEAKRRKEAGTYPTERFTPGLVGPIQTNTGPAYFELDLRGRVYLRPLSNRRLRILDEDIIEKVRAARRRQDAELEAVDAPAAEPETVDAPEPEAEEVPEGKGRAADSKGNPRADAGEVAGV